MQVDRNAMLYTVDCDCDKPAQFCIEIGFMFMYLCNDCASQLQESLQKLLTQ